MERVASACLSTLLRGRLVSLLQKSPTPGKQTERPENQPSEEMNHLRTSTGASVRKRDRDTGSTEERDVEGSLCLQEVQLGVFKGQCASAGNRSLPVSFLPWQGEGGGEWRSDGIETVFPSLPLGTSCAHGSLAFDQTKRPRGAPGHSLVLGHSGVGPLPRLTRPD